MSITRLLLLLLATTPASGGALRNGDFEVLADGAPAHWEVAARAATVGPDRVRGKWYHFVCDVKTGRFDRITLYLSLADGTGSTWWDNFTSPNLAIANPSFEQVGPDGRLAGWQQDNVDVTVFSDGQRVTHGRRALRLTHADPDRPLSRVRQVIAVDKNSDYRFEFDIYLSDDCTARPNIATLTYESDGKYSGSPMWIRTASWSDIRTERAGHGEHVGLMQLQGGEAELRQAFTFPVDGNGEAAVRVKTRSLAGRLRLLIEDVASGALCGAETVDQPDADWHEIRARFRTAGNDQLRLRLVGTGTGEIRLDDATVRVGRELVPPVQHVHWLPASENFALGERLTVSVDRPTDALLDGAMAILARDLSGLGIAVQRTGAGAADLEIRVGPGRGVRDRGPESYSLVVNPLKMWIAADTHTGVLRAIATLVQLLEPGGDGHQALTCEISDWPDMPVRGAFWSPAFGFEQHARYKFNTMYYSTSHWLDWIHEPQHAPALEAVFEQAERHGIEIIASTAVFQGHWAYRFHDPNLAEGKGVSQRLTLKGRTPARLAHALILRTALRGLEVRSPDGTTIYEEGRDYVVERGTPLTYPFHELVDAVPDAVARIADGAIPDGADVVAIYDYTEPTTKSELCMAEPEATSLVADALARTFERFPRLRYFNINLDEIEYFNSSNLTRSDPRSPEAKLGDWIGALDAAVRGVRPEARLVTWDDMLSPFDRAGKMGFTDFARVMPEKVIALSWGYTPVVPRKTGWPTVRYWSQAGIGTMVVPWYDERNIRGWAQVVAEARRRGWPCLGMIDSFWHNRANYRETAMCTWRIPRQGERRWLAVVDAE